MNSPAVHAPRRPRPPLAVGQDAALLVLAAALLAASALPVNAQSISEAEADVFGAVNTHTLLPFLIVWPVMQLGNIVAVPVAAALASIFRRWRLAFAMLAGGTAVYFLAKVVKGLVVRGRPSTLLPDVIIRGAAATGRGYVSGHAAVVALITTLAWPYLRGAWRWVIAAIAVLVCLARVYVGAHLPLDVVGGAALGVAVGAIARIVFGPPRRDR